MAASDIILCTPAAPNNVTLYDPAIGCGSAINWTKSLSDTIILSDTNVKSVVSFRSDSVILSDIRFSVTGKARSDSVTLSDTRFSGIGKAFADTISLSDSETINFVSDFTYEVREDKMTKLVREFIRDTVGEIRDDVAFYYARQSDFNSVKNKPQGIKVLLAPLDRSDKSPDDSMSTHCEYRCVLMIMQFDEVKGSEEETEGILDDTEKFLRQFQAKIKLLSLNEGVEEGLKLSTDTTDVSEENITAFIKFTSDCVTGWEYEFKLSVPDQFDYCAIY